MQNVENYLKQYKIIEHGTNVSPSANIMSPPSGNKMPPAATPIIMPPAATPPMFQSPVPSVSPSPVKLYTPTPLPLCTEKSNDRSSDDCIIPPTHEVRFECKGNNPCKKWMVPKKPKSLD